MLDKSNEVATEKNELNSHNAEIRRVFCDQRRVEYRLTRKNVKNVNLRIKADGSILISANYDVSVEFIDNFVKHKQEIIIRTLDEYEKRRKHLKVSSRSYISGEVYEILGRSLQLKVAETCKEEVLSDENFIFLNVLIKEDFSKKEKLMNGWLKKYQLKVFTRICDETYMKFKVYNVPYPVLKIRNMTSRWGSCRPEKGIITLNSRLIEVPEGCIEYVVLHEFAQFIHPNQSKDFYDFIAVLMPDWKERKIELDNRVWTD